jgi:ArsR family transcriptional regulator
MSNYLNSPLDDEKIEKFATIFKALSNPHRLKIFLSLFHCAPVGQHCDTDLDGVEAFQGCISKELSLAPSTISHHIKELRNAGLIKYKRNGQNISFWVDPNTIEFIETFLDKGISK